MAYSIDNLFNNDDLRCVWPKDGEDCGPFAVYEWIRDLSVDASTAQRAYFASEMDIRRRHLICDLSRGSVSLQNGAMQMLIGDARAKTGVKDAGDLMRKIGRAMVSDEDIVKPEYEGSGLLMCEPTYQHLICTDTAFFGGAAVLDDGCFMACESKLKESVYRIKGLGATFAGNEGIWKLQLSGSGRFVIESPCPENELIVIDLENDELRLDGPYALVWSQSLNFTVERVTKTLIGSAASGEGLVNVYRGTGRVLMTPTQTPNRLGFGG